MPVTAPPLKATSSAFDTPERADSATRAFARTDTFMPMKPAAPEKVPPMRKPMATRMPSASEASSSTASTIASTTATPAMIVYWRFRYAVAPTCTACEMRCISALPGESASSQRDVSTP